MREVTSPMQSLLDLASTGRAVQSEASATGRARPLNTILLAIVFV